MTTPAPMVARRHRSQPPGGRVGIGRHAHTGPVSAIRAGNRYLYRWSLRTRRLHSGPSRARRRAVQPRAGRPPPDPGTATMPNITATAGVLDHVVVIDNDGPTRFLALRNRARAARRRATEVRDEATATRLRAREGRAAARGRLSDTVTGVQHLRAQLDSAETRAETLQRGLLSNRRIGMAVGILMCRCQLTEEQAFDVLREHSQHVNTKVRELAETVIYTGGL